MALNIENLRRHYASLTDEALEEIDPADLTAEARQCLDAELAKRVPAEEEQAGAEDAEAEAIEEGDPDVEPDWIEGAALAISYGATPGSDRGADAEHARRVLLAAGVPCYVAMPEPNPDDDYFPNGEYRVLVPGPLSMKAGAILEKEIFNPELEESWRAHFTAISDDELRALKPDVICAGMRDRIERLTRLYNQEVARRRSC